VGLYDWPGQNGHPEAKLELSTIPHCHAGDFAIFQDATLCRKDLNNPQTAV